MTLALHGFPPQEGHHFEPNSMLKAALRGLISTGYDFYNVRTFHRYGANHRYRGVYDSYQAALNSAPANGLHGFDHREVAEYFAQTHFVFNPHDYALLFWISRILSSYSPETRRVIFDFGGGVGQSFYTFEQRLPFPAGIRWRVCDLEAPVERGTEIALERNVADLEFTTSFSGAEGADIFLTTGALHCMDEDLATLLAGLQKLPTHVLVNRVPMYDGKAYYTLQHNDHSYVPNKVMNREAFIRRMEGLGYRSVDQWYVARTIRIPFHPERHVREFHGFYFRL